MSNATKKLLSDAERLDWLRLIRSENVGPITFYRLLDHFGSVADALAGVPELSKRGGRKRAVKVCPKATVTAELEALDKIGARLVAQCEPDYPPLLAQIEDAPPLISVLGHPHLLRKAAVGMVGARNASLNGRQLAQKMAADLGAGGLLVVSGMARGIDTAAHEGALETGTIAVLAGGVDVIYPKENAGLYERLVEGAAVVSEIVPGTQPQARHFPRRNRIISGIARGVVVVEAGARSGSLITARCALDQNREVFAVPGSPLDARARGPNDLIRQGAQLTESAKDVLGVLNDLFKMPLSERRGAPSSNTAKLAINEPELIQARKTIVELMGSTPVMVDELIRSSQFSPAVVNTVLLELELANRAERHPGNRVSVIGEII